MYVLSNFDLLCLYTWQEKGFHEKKIVGFLQQKFFYLYLFLL